MSEPLEALNITDSASSNKGQENRTHTTQDTFNPLPKLDESPLVSTTSTLYGLALTNLTLSRHLTAMTSLSKHCHSQGVLKTFGYVTGLSRSQNGSATKRCENCYGIPIRIHVNLVLTLSSGRGSRAVLDLYFPSYQRKKIK